MQLCHFARTYVSSFGCLSLDTRQLPGYTFQNPTKLIYVVHFDVSFLPDTDHWMKITDLMIFGYSFLIASY